MATTVEVALDAKLYESLKEVSAEQGTSPEYVLRDLTQKYLIEVRRRKIDEEFAAYYILHPRLKVEYIGQYIAIHNGELVDHDEDANELLNRIRERYGRQPILITQVEEQPMYEYYMRSPRMVRPR